MDPDRSATGPWQGEGGSAVASHGFYENVDPCHEYHAESVGFSPNVNAQFFLVKYTGDGLEGPFTCPGTQSPNYYAYKFQLKKGSPNNNPFFYGYMRTLDGRADANTEVHGSPPIPYSYFGCDSAGSCSDADYGVEVYGTSGWNLCCANERSIGPANPAYRHTYDQYWAFRTFPTSSC